jgi:hypothetical protein
MLLEVLSYSRRIEEVFARNSTGLQTALHLATVANIRVFLRKTVIREGKQLIKTVIREGKRLMHVVRVSEQGK